MPVTSKRKRNFTITIRQPWCKGCYLCLEVCPKDVFELSERVAMRGFREVDATRLGDCTGCLLCELMCPDVAIRVEETDGDARHEE